MSIKISQLTNGTALTGTEMVPVVQGGETVKVPASMFVGSPSVVVKTYAEMATMIAANSGAGSLAAGQLYKISDRGDRGIFLRALTPNTLYREGVRIMLCPKTYKSETLDGNVWKSVWRNYKTANIGDLFIHGSIVWKNKTGNIGNETGQQTLDLVNWEKVEKINFANHEYVEEQFNISYDFENDWIEKQSNSWLKVGIPFKMYELLGLNFIPVEVTSWNIETAGAIVADVNLPLGFINNNPETDIPFATPQYSNITAAMVIENDTVYMTNIRVNSKLENSANDTDAFGVITKNETPVISDIYQTGGIKDIPANVDGYKYHTDDESAYFEIDFSEFPLVPGTPFFTNCIQHEHVSITEMCVKGINITDTAGNPLVATTSNIKIGIETDHPDYITASPATYVTVFNGNGYKKQSMSIPTSDRCRRMVIEAVGATFVEGILKVSFKYL